MELLISLIAGAIGGNIAGGLMKNLNLGLWVNSLAGLIGGGLGGQVLGWLGAGGLTLATSGSEYLDPMALAGQVAASGLGGGIFLVFTGLLRNALTR